MTIQERKQKLKGEILIAQKMVKYNVLTFRPIGYILPSTIKDGQFTNEIFDVPINKISEYIPIISSMMLNYKQGWKTYLSEAFIEYIKLKFSVKK